MKNSELIPNVAVNFFRLASFINDLPIGKTTFSTPRAFGTFAKSILPSLATAQGCAAFQL
jgi:hypothetical protein